MSVFSVFTLASPLSFFFFNDTATTEIYTLSLHDALPISLQMIRAQKLKSGFSAIGVFIGVTFLIGAWSIVNGDRKSTRLNSSHGYISYAVFCLKKKKKETKIDCQSHQESDSP